MPDRRAGRGAWALTTLLVAALAVATVLAARAAESGPRPRFVAGSGVEPSSLGPGLHLAGSGACLPLARQVATRFHAAHPEVRVVVHESIGSTGGVRAVSEGAIAVGLVSRPLSEAEQELGLELVPFARVPVVVIAHGETPDADLTRADLVATFRGDRDRWSDGAPLIVLLRERGDSAQGAMARVLPELGAALEGSLASERFRVVYHDEDLLRGVAEVRGAIGISDLVQAARASVRVLSIDGVEPSVAAMREGRYPFHRELALVLAPDAGADARALARFVRSDEITAMLEAAGALPIGEGSP